MGFAIGLLATVSSFDFRLRARGTPANIVIDASGRGDPITTDWFHAFAQGGEEHADMIGPVVTQVSALRPKFIRLDHVYDGYAIVRRDGQGLIFDWTKLDAAIDSIVKTGATPVLSLSYMPDVIAKDARIINPPNVWLEWTSVVKTTIEHVSGTKNIPGVYYEVWNEPDLAQFGGWKYYGGTNYLSLYSFAARGAAQVKNTQSFYFGGPSTTGLYKSWMEALVKSGSKLDFLSWHVYDKSPSRIREDVERLRQWFADNPRVLALPILITEFGFTGSKDLLYGSSYAAAYTAATIRQVWDIQTRPILFTFELKDGPGQQDGWGLIGHESFGSTLKPRYHVFQFLDQLKGTRLPLQGEGSWVTALAYRENSMIRALFINVDSDTPGGTHSENVPVRIERLNPGTYQMRLRYFSGAVVTKEEIVIGDTWQKDIYIPANELILLEFSPK